MDGYKTHYIMHGLKAYCRYRDGHAIPFAVEPLADGNVLADELRRDPELCMMVWDWLEDRRAETERGNIPDRDGGWIKCNTRNKTLDTPQTKGIIAATIEKDGGNVQQR